MSIGKEAGDVQNKISVTFFEPNIIEKETFLELEVKGVDTLIFSPGNPLLPVQSQTYYLPFGATITSIGCTVQEVKTMVLPKKIQPAPQPVPLTNEITISSEPIINQEVYDSDQLYPNDWFSYNIGVGLDKNMEHKTLLTIRTYPIRYSPKSDTIYYTEKVDVSFEYKTFDSTPFKTGNPEYKLVIITPPVFKKYAEELRDHKVSKGVSTNITTTTEIYDKYTGWDKPEQIKYFIKDAIETWNTSYVLLFGGLNSFINAIPRDDSSQGSQDWYVPVRYSNLKSHPEDDPGYMSDLYYADIYEAGGVFCSWDSNGNHIYGEYKFAGDKLDLYPDVAVGRLPCRTTTEAKAVIKKIINYEKEPADPSWFNKMVVVSGDGFLDQLPWNIYWNTVGLPNGQYTIYAQSKNIDGIYGPIDEITVTIDKTRPTTITFNHDDHLTTGLKYPFPPVAEIVTVSDGDILGNTDYVYTPAEWEAYCNQITGWANIQYKNGILKIGGKTYDPKPYRVFTDLHVWVNNSAGTTVFTITKTDFKMYWEGEWCTGEQELHGRAGGAYYMPDSFEKILLWTSNGKFTKQKDVLDVLNKGAGFVFFSGHGSPGVWADHYPGVPGNRRKGSVTGLMVFNYNIFPLPVFPIGSLKNNFKNPIVVVGGCHNSMFNVSLIPTLKDKNNNMQTHCWGIPTPECWSERLVNVGKGGAIATIGNTGYGYGVLSEFCTVGGFDGYITTEFFVQYGVHGHDILGETHSQSITEYLNHFDSSWDATHQKSVEQWVLLGDPSLKIGGYPAI
ncbi:MAG: C25 family cysteine peptidase [Thermoplasmatota archaeon]